MDYPISTYGENIIILVQNVILVFMLWTYANPPFSSLHMIAVTVGLGGAAFGSLVLPKELLMYLPITTTTLAVMGRVPQLAANFSQGHTGQLSLITTALNLLGNIARIFTTLQETADVFVLASFVIAGVMNTALVAQVLLIYLTTPVRSVLMSCCLFT